MEFKSPPLPLYEEPASRLVIHPTEFALASSSLALITVALYSPVGALPEGFAISSDQFEAVFPTLVAS